MLLMKIKSLLLLSLILLLTSCFSSPAAETKVYEFSELSSQNRSLDISLEHGSIELIFTETDSIELRVTAGPVLWQDLLIDAKENRVNISLGESLSNVAKKALRDSRFQIEIPNETAVTLSTFDARITLTGEGLAVNIRSVSSSVQLNHFKGNAAIVNNRGPVTVENSTGQIEAIGNYGLIQFLQSHGKLVGSTIMGNIRVDSNLDEVIDLKLETDHGDVEIKLSNPNDLNVMLNSASGDVVCDHPALDSSTRYCRGTIGNAASRIQVRTVSGRIGLTLR
mgnify:FL=1